MPAVRPALPPGRTGGPPPLPADGPGRWALDPGHPGYCVNDTTGEVRTAWRPTTVNGAPAHRPLGPWKPMTPFRRFGVPHVRIRSGTAGGTEPVAELVAAAFGPDAPYLRQSANAKGVAR